VRTLEFLVRAKGVKGLGRRAVALGRRYGVTPARMVAALEALVEVLDKYGCPATFPVTAVALARHPTPIRRLQGQGIELAAHGWTHVDLEDAPMEQQVAHMSRAQAVFDRHGISAVGFRSPYLRRNGSLRKAAVTAGFRYVSNQPVLWDVVGEVGEAGGQGEGDRAQAYQQAVDFYEPWSAARRLSVPILHERIVEIPVSLPDDEMLVERLGADGIQIAEAWASILRQTYADGELFTVQLHPERAEMCIPALERVLGDARSYSPPVWIARLDEIAAWWQRRRAVRIDIVDKGHKQYDVTIRGDAEVSVLVRRAEVMGTSQTRADGYNLTWDHRFAVRCESRPCVGVSQRTDKGMVQFLKDQGYPVELSREPAGYAVYLDRPSFRGEDERFLVREIEGSKGPMIRVNRWPGGARSGLAISGDIDALTLWDYGQRLFGS
jgi:peptidoglycan/xylan/chitin deacetylase (PgdA/CDA1 family)